MSKAVGIEYQLHCSWRPQSSAKVEKAYDVIKRYLRKLTQEPQDNWLKVLPIALKRAQTAYKKEVLSPFECIYGRPFVHIDIVIDPEALELTMWLSFQPFKRHCGNSGRWFLTPPLSQTTTVWARHRGPDKDSGIWRPISRAPLGRPLPDSSFFSHSFQGARNWFLGETTLKLKSGTLAKTKQCHFMSSSSMLSPFTFQMGLIIYVGLLLLTPKVLSLPPDPKDSAFLSWTHSYCIPPLV